MACGCQDTQKKADSPKTKGGEQAQAKKEGITPVKKNSPAKSKTSGPEHAGHATGSVLFMPDLKITAPKLGTLAVHPWWRQPMTDAQIGKIIFAIAHLPVRQELLFVDSDGQLSASPDDPPTMKGDACALLEGEKDKARLLFFGAAGIPLTRPTPRAVVVSLLAQGLDAAYASEEAFRKTGKGFTSWDRFLRMADVDFDTSTPLGNQLKNGKLKQPGGAIGPPSAEPSVKQGQKK